ncbi:MAG: hypothetical protein JEZ09_08535 [Salinivirgaceae bacterium]|nr:hypothetical protein [Salinivirgaceae bacterium]
MKKLKLEIEKFSCLRTSIELGKDEIYCGGFFIPVKKEGKNIKWGKVTNFVTNDFSMGKGVMEVRVDYECELDYSGYDDYMLIFQLIEKDDGIIQQKFKNDEVAKEFENIDIIGNAIRKLLESLDLEGIDLKDILASLTKMVVKGLPAVIISLVGDIAKQIKMDDIISTKQFSKQEVEKFSSSTEFLFSKMFAKYNVTIKMTEL